LSKNLLERPLPPEGQDIEYKRTLTQPSILARVIASFANTEGGRIIIGVDDGNIVGLSDETLAKAPKLIEQASLLLQPQPSLNYHVEEIDGKSLFVIEVQTCQAPITTEDQRYYIRRGASNVLMEEDFIARLVTAVPGLKSNVLKSFTLKDDDTVRPENMNRFTRIVHEKIEETTDITKIYTILLEPIKRTRDETTTQLNECRWQKRITFLVALIFLIIAIVLVAIGILFIYFGHLQGGVVSTASSILSGAVSGLAFTFNKQANDRNDTFYRELVTLERSYAIIECIPLITDIQMRNETLRDLIKNNVSEKR
jgi:flagellar basal body-associated protein FliL